MDNITAVRYTWTSFNNYSSQTFGDYSYDSEIERITESYDGCVFGIFGSLAEEDSG